MGRTSVEYPMGCIYDNNRQMSHLMTWRLWFMMDEYGQLLTIYGCNHIYDTSDADGKLYDQKNNYKNCLDEQFMHSLNWTAFNDLWV